MSLNNSIQIIPLGAGREVGRSCILLRVYNRHILLDCGVHMGYSDHRQFPDFSYLSNKNLNTVLDCVIISHFHLDHCGALPFLTGKYYSN
jgi:integrator complex subunit 11